MKARAIWKERRGGWANEKIGAEKKFNKVQVLVVGGADGECKYYGMARSGEVPNQRPVWVVDGGFRFWWDGLSWGERGYRLWNGYDLGVRKP